MTIFSNIPHPESCHNPPHKIRGESRKKHLCGHISNCRCEEACTRGTVDEAIAIDEVKKFLAMRDLNAETRFIPKKVINWRRDID